MFSVLSCAMLVGFCHLFLSSVLLWIPAAFSEDADEEVR